MPRIGKGAIPDGLLALEVPSGAEQGFLVTEIQQQQQVLMVPPLGAWRPPTPCLSQPAALLHGQGMMHMEIPAAPMELTWLPEVRMVKWVIDGRKKPREAGSLLGSWLVVGAVYIQPGLKVGDLSETSFPFSSFSPLCFYNNTFSQSLVFYEPCTKLFPSIIHLFFHDFYIKSRELRSFWEVTEASGGSL